MAQLGGQELSGIGFGLGTDRTMLACIAEGLDVGPKFAINVFMIALGETAKDHVVSFTAQLRAAGVSVDLAFGDRALKGAMKAADRSGARWAIIVGEKELADGRVQIKDMVDGEQRSIPVEDVVGQLMTEGM